MQKYQNKNNKGNNNNKKQQISYANKTLKANQGKHPEKKDKSITYYGVATKGDKQIFVSEVKATNEAEAFTTLQEIAAVDGLDNLQVKPFANSRISKFRYNNN